jgi:isoleucyl-tRNA synthetase
MSKKKYFEEVDLGVDFPKMERSLLDDWYKNGIVDKYLNRNKDSKKYFSFLDGPITANNPMGVHHAWGRTYKDLWQRFYNMKGRRQRFQNGFDCQGLWVEVEVEKELGLKTKRDIENLIPGDKYESLAKFINLCKERVNKYANIQTEQSKRLGYFMDWDHSYYTMSEDNNYMIWRYLKECNEKKLIYKGRDSVPWCPRCGTAISQHEILTEDYKEITHRSIFFELPIIGRENEYLLVWTTTPWTIPGNVAVAVDPAIEYSLVSGEDGNKFYLASGLVSSVYGKDFKVIKTIKGKDLLGLKYRGPFDNLPRVKKASDSDTFHRVVAGDPMILPVTTDEGTGMVHIATGAGAEDYKLGEKLGLPVIEVIEEDASYMSGFGEFSSKNAKNNPELILDYLEKSTDNNGGNWVFEIRKYKHRYPACWRCKSELVWRVVDEWYIAMDKPYGEQKIKYRDAMKWVTKKIKWMPGFGLRRELDWLDNMHDWLISKKRYWGLALPIWECKKCNNFVVIGSREELKEKASSGWEKFEGNSPHRPWIDQVKIKCEKCGAEMNRIEDVGNPWLDAGIVPYSTISSDNKSKPLFEINKDEWEKWFPADFITESFPGQFKNWFYSMIAMSTILTDREPFSRVLGFATLLDEKGKPMHKSAGNAIEFNEGADKIGVDVMRWMYLRQNPSDNLLFGYHAASEVRRKFHLKIWNIYNFFVTYANLDNWEPSGGLPKTVPYGKNILDRWILMRFKQTLDDVNHKLTKFDAFHSALTLEDFVEDFSNWFIRRSRDRVGPWVKDTNDKQDFYNTTYFVLTNLALVLAPMTPFLAENMFRNLTKKPSVHLADWPEFEMEIDDKLIGDMANIRNVVENVHAIRKEKGIAVRQPLYVLSSVLDFEVPEENLWGLLLDELNIKKWEVKKGKELSHKLDTEISDELRDEFLARELIRKIQIARKEKGVDLKQKVKVKNDWVPENKKLLEQILNKTGSENLEKGKFEISLI